MKQSNHWCSPIYLKGTMSGSSCVKVYDITMSLHIPPLTTSIHPHSDFLFDTSQFVGAEMETQSKIQNYIVGACRESGFYLMPNSKSKRKPVGNRLATICFNCSHHKLSQGRQTKSSKRKISGHSPVFMDTNHCTFEMSIFCDKLTKYWYLNKGHSSSPNCYHHYGHFQQPPFSIRTPSTSISSEEIELASAADNEKSLSASTITDLLNLLNKGNSHYSRKQISNLLVSNERKKLNNILNSPSSAEKLLASFEKMVEDGMDLSYVSLFHDFEFGFYIKYPKGRPTKVDIDSDMNITEIREAMNVNNKQKILLSFAWISDAERDSMKKFGYFVTFDCTDKTNKEKRSLFIGTGQDGNGKLFSALHCYMPNAQLDSFQWIYKIAIPFLWGSEVVKKLNVVITDGERNLYSPIENASQTNSDWNGCKVYRCTFHLFTQELVKRVR